MSLSSAKIRDHAVIEQFRAAGRLVCRNCPANYPRRILSGSFGRALVRGRFGPGNSCRAAAKKESAVKPGSVLDSHSSGIRVTAQLKRPTRKPMWATCSGV